MPNNGMHPTADTLPLMYIESRGAAGDAGRYVQIVECNPYESFAYDEKWMPLNGKGMADAYTDDHRVRMEFFLQSHPEATRVEIRRRIKGHRLRELTDLLDAIFYNERPVQRAAYHLSIRPLAKVR